MSRRVPVLLVLVSAMLAVWWAPAWAHPSIEVTAVPAAVETPSTAAWHAAPIPPGLPWRGVLITAAAAIVLARRPRRALAVAIVIVLAVFAFENGVHSVHHLNDHRSAAACAVASGTTHVGGTPVDSVTIEPVVLPSPERLVFEQQLNLDAPSLAVHQGRAPPLAA